MCDDNMQALPRWSSKRAAVVVIMIKREEMSGPERCFVLQFRQRGNAKFSAVLLALTGRLPCQAGSYNPRPRGRAVHCACSQR